MNALQKLNNSLKAELGIHDDFDRLNDIKFDKVPCLPLTVGASLMVIKEKKRRGQDINIEIKLPNRGGLVQS